MAPPQEIKNAIRQREDDKQPAVSALSQNFLQGVDLSSVLAAQNAAYLTNQLQRNFLDQDFLSNMLILLNEQLAVEFGNLLAPQKTQLCRTDTGNNTSCITTPKDQNSTITQTQSDNIAIKNRINQGGNTFITIKQN